jgi:hypothetical protein
MANFFVPAASLESKLTGRNVKSGKLVYEIEGSLAVHLAGTQGGTEYTEYGAWIRPFWLFAAIGVISGLLCFVLYRGLAVRKVEVR